MIKSRLLDAVYVILLGPCIVGTATAAPITIGAYTFAGPEAFPTDATYVSGQTVYIEHPPGTSWNSVPGNSTTDLDAALTGYDLTFGVNGEGIDVDLTFGSASILNAVGSDLVIFETVFEENFDLAIYSGSTLSSPLTYWSVSTGLTVGDVVGTTNTAMLNAVEIDLSDFGIGLGEAVSEIRLYTQPVGVPPEDSTAGADIVAIGALHTVPIPPAIDIEKLTNGNQADGANDSDVPRIAAGDIVTWTYLVTNTGEVEVSEAEVVVTDDQLEFTPNGPTNDDGDTILSPGETWFYTATAQVLDLSTPPAGVTVVPGCDDGRNVYQNTGRVEVSATEVFDEDLSHYCNFGVADVDIRKQAEGPDTRTFTSGSDVPFEIVATNTGDEDLSNVAVNDPEVSDCDRNIGALAAGASVRYTCIASSVTITFDNEACVTGERNGVTVEDCDPSTVEILAANNPPDCSHAVASLDTLWPPNHKFVSVNVLGVTDLDGDPVTITIDSIFQDEPVDTGGGRFVPDGQGVGTDAALVRAERSGTRRVPGNGRVYHIGFTAEDDKGEACSAEVLVGAPHDRNTAPVDNGAIYDSTVP